MKFSFFVYFWMISLVSSVKPKFCINCKYFIPDTNSNNVFAKCSQFPQENTNYLIDGKITLDEYRYCSTARSYENLCGQEGKKYKPLPKKKSS